MAATLRKRAMDFLARREHSRAELRRKLISKDYLPDDVDSVLEVLEQDGLLSDERFAENYVRHRAAAGQGPRTITRELEQKGVGSDLIAAHVPSEREVWLERMQAVWEKKFRGEAPGTPAERAKQTRFLMQRGFDPSEIAHFLKMPYSADSNDS